MKKLTSTEIRNMWIEFFKSKKHLIIDSAPLVPINDDSLLFINAGVTPLKKYFDGREVPENKRLANIQKCIRTNDIENVGLTSRHQTFFEMLGNFSIGDYFKEEAIEYAFELLTSQEWFAMDKDRLYVSVYLDDEIALNKWLSLGIHYSHITRLEGNYWEIGEGPSGPNSEIFYDRGEKYDPHHDAYTKWQEDEDQDRFVEIWNIVFSQFNAKTGVRRSEYKELPNKNIDTGAGLERWAMISQEVDSNFETDLFTSLIKKEEELTGILYTDQSEFRIIADHIRTVTVALSDGALFENSGRGYVLRRLLRRSVRMGRKLGLDEPFLYKLVETVIENLKDSYPALTKTSGVVKTLILHEEELFHKTLSSGEKKLLEMINNAASNKLSGEEVFRLYDTYGFPFELTLEYLNEYNFMTDKSEFDLKMAEQKSLAKKSRRKTASMNSQNKALLNFKEKSEFIYDKYKLNAKIIGLFDDEKELETIKTTGLVILDETCFYAESGGQVADTGLISGKDFTARVLDVQKAPNGQSIHSIKVLNGTMKKNDKVELVIDKEKRLDTEKNHSAVHLLQYSLRTLVSDNIKQAGSFVNENGFRFDFSYGDKISEERLIEIEDFVNRLINENVDTKIEYMSLEDAKKLGAMALFTEKYGNIVRVVTIGNSVELCGGTHVKNTSDIKRLAIYNLESKGSNVYRIEGCTDKNIEQVLPRMISPYNNEMIKLLMKAKNIIKDAKKENISLDFDIHINNDTPTSIKDIIFNKNELEYIKAEIKNLEKSFNNKLEASLIKSSKDYLEGVEVINGINILIKKITNFDTTMLKTLVDDIFNQMPENSFVLFINLKEDSINFVSKSNSSIKSGEVVKTLSVNAGGNGGGSPMFAQGGGVSSDNLEKDLLQLKKHIKEV